MRLIDADALAMELLSHTYLGCDGGYYRGMSDERDSILETIAEQPTIEPKRGEWIGYASSAYNGTDDCGEPKWIPEKFYRCSECRKGTVVQSNFCPNCGADMRSEDVK